MAFSMNGSNGGSGFGRSRFRVRGDVVDIQPAYEEVASRVEFFGDEVERIVDFDPLTGEILGQRDELAIFPASHYVTPKDKLERALRAIDAELEQRSGDLEQQGRLLEAQRLRQRLLAARTDAPVHALNGALWLRISAHAYNDLADYQALADIVSEMV